MARSMKSVCTIIGRKLFDYRPVCARCVCRRFYTADSISYLSSYSNRSHTCGELRSSNVGEEVKLCGWVQHQRYGKFLLLRDSHGSVQITVDDEIGESLSKLSFESVVEIIGCVRARPSGQENQKMATGSIEVVLKDMKVLNGCKPQLPFEIHDFHEVKEPLRMKYRYLDLRNKMMQYNLRLRSHMVLKMRNFLCNKHGFVDVETPTLFCKTPGGAQEFVVPTQTSGDFYSLPQSPQQFKQLLMVGGIDRYVQIARCYRDEGARPDRQPEFTQVDLEMSFVNQDHILQLVEDQLQDCWPLTPLNTPFPRYTYHQVMSLYGVDKPDTRFDMKIQDVTSILENKIEVFNKINQSSSNKKSIQLIHIPQAAGQLSNTLMKNLIESSQKLSYKLPVLVFQYSKDGVWSNDIYKHIDKDTISNLHTALNVQPNDVLCLSCGPEYQPNIVLGRLRLMIADALEAKGVTVRDRSKFNFLWVYEFPLFLPKEDGSEGIESAHHPFTAPDPRDEQLLYDQPLKVRSQHYDLVLNGFEIGGGSIRIHQADVQKYVLQDILNEDTSKLQHLLEALDSGCPPHGGIALGLDRLMAIVCQASSIRDVIAFPKSGEGKDLMSGAPSKLSQADLDLYHIKVTDS